MLSFLHQYSRRLITSRAQNLYAKRCISSNSQPLSRGNPPDNINPNPNGNGNGNDVVVPSPPSGWRVGFSALLLAGGAVLGKLLFEKYRGEKVTANRTLNLFVGNKEENVVERESDVDLESSGSGDVEVAPLFDEVIPVDDHIIPVDVDVDVAPDADTDVSPGDVDITPSNVDAEFLPLSSDSGPEEDISPVTMIRDIEEVSPTFRDLLDNKVSPQDVISEISQEYAPAESDGDRDGKEAISREEGLLSALIAVTETPENDIPKIGDSEESNGSFPGPAIPEETEIDLFETGNLGEQGGNEVEQLSPFRQALIAGTEQDDGDTSPTSLPLPDAEGATLESEDIVGQVHETPALEVSPSRSSELELEEKPVSEMIELEKKSLSILKSLEDKSQKIEGLVGHLSHDVEASENIAVSAVVREVLESSFDTLRKQKDELEEVRNHARNAVSEAVRREREEHNAELQRMAEGYNEKISSIDQKMQEQVNMLYAHFIRQIEKYYMDKEKKVSTELQQVSDSYEDAMNNLEQRLVQIEAREAKQQHWVMKLRRCREAAFSLVKLGVLVSSMQRIVSSEPSVLPSIPPFPTQLQGQESQDDDTDVLDIAPVPTSIVNEIEGLIAIAEGHSVLQELLNDVPTKQMNQGLLSYPQFYSEFLRLKPRAKQSGILEEKGWYIESPEDFYTELVTETKTLFEGHDTASSLSRAHYYLWRGDLHHAVAEVEGLSPTVKAFYADWLQYAHRRERILDLSSRLSLYLESEMKLLNSGECDL